MAKWGLPVLMYHHINNHKKNLVTISPQDFERQMEYLFREGYKTLDMKECLERLKKKKPDLILLDIRMPGMDGWDVLKEIKREERTKAIPVMMYTVVEKSPDDETLRERGVDDYVVKPFRLEDLVHKVQKILKKK